MFCPLTHQQGFESPTGRQSQRMCWYHEVTFEQAERYYEALKWMPKSMTAELASRPMAEVAAEMRSGVLKRPRSAGATAAKKIQLLNAMFGYAATRGWIPAGNAFGRVAAPKDSKPRIKRRPWKPDDLAAIFAAPLFTGCTNYSDWRHRGEVLIANHRFWVASLGMVTGGRLEEIG
jgi:hypothetical protein